ncbi:hypothetical protein [Paraburkholderia sp. J76]|uniref:hypothetical protein n=1 Tax=Paraburkholderia sp. J76 TaxID=2805439 RepID=UPI002ABD7D85|nr:hypothetical protein [Paraburkholderia sp. J76]
MKSLFLSLILLLANTCIAEEIQLGVISNRNCSKLSYDQGQQVVNNQNLQKNQSTQQLQKSQMNKNDVENQQYQQKQFQPLLPSRIYDNSPTTLSVQLESTADGDGQENLVKLCALRVRDRMELLQIDFDPIEASPVFQQALQNCVNASDPGIQIRSAILKSKGPCR